MISLQIFTILFLLLLTIKCLRGETVYRGKHYIFLIADRIYLKSSYQIRYSIAVVCKDNLDYILACQNHQAILIRNYATKHSSRQFDIDQQCDGPVGFTHPKSAEDILTICHYHHQRQESQCLLSSSFLKNQFKAQALPDPYWNPVPKSLDIKYICLGRIYFYLM